MGFPALRATQRRPGRAWDGSHGCGPVAGAALAVTLGGYTPVFALLALVAALAALLIAGTVPSPHPTEPDER